MTRRELDQLNEGDRVLVFVEDAERWEPAVVLDPRRRLVLWRGQEWSFAAADMRAPRRVA